MDASAPKRVLTIPPAVSVVIPCFNQGHFLAEAIESVLGQEGPSFEVIVVDDGSTDDTAAVASRYPEVVLLRQRNRGLAAARNRGLSASRGRYLVFLDSDDRLLPGALSAGLSALESHQECAFTYGRLQATNRDSSSVWIPPQRPVDSDHYRQLLLGCFIVNLSVAMYRREVFGRVGGFSSTRRLQGCEDYDLYLRITRLYPVYRHNELVSEWRRYPGSMSRNAYNMLRHVLHVHRSQRKFVKSDPELLEAYIDGKQYWQEWYGEQLVNEFHCLMRSRKWGAALMRLLTLARHYRQGLWALIRGLPESNHVVFEVVANGHIPPEIETKSPVRGSLLITSLQPNHAIVGHKFSQLKISCQNATRWTTIIFAGQPLQTQVHDQNTVTAAVPDDILHAEGRWPVYLLK